MRIDTGQQLAIVYTTESLLIVTPKDDHTSMAITKILDELSCHIAVDAKIMQIILPLISYPCSYDGLIFKLSLFAHC